MENIIIEIKRSPLFHEMICIQGGEFVMSSNDYDDEKPFHQVKVKHFCLGKYPVTQSLWQAIMLSNPSYFKGENRPVENVSWYDVQDFIVKLNKATGEKFRLPTEVEWEFAARGGKKSKGYLYAGSDNLNQVGWHTKNSSGETHDVGQLRPNELGLYDMSGNVWEWCEDQFGDYRVLRGGSWVNLAIYCRPTHRFRRTPGYRDDSLGFRLAF